MLLGLRSLQRRQTRQKKTRGAEQAKETDRSRVSLSPYSSSSTWVESWAAAASSFPFFPFSFAFFPSLNPSLLSPPSASLDFTGPHACLASLAPHSYNCTTIFFLSSLFWIAVLALLLLLQLLISNVYSLARLRILLLVSTTHLTPLISSIDRAVCGFSTSRWNWCIISCHMCGCSMQIISWIMSNYQWTGPFHAMHLPS